MAKAKFDQEQAFKQIKQILGIEEEPQGNRIEPIVEEEQSQPPTQSREQGKVARDKKYVPQMVYITKEQKKALKLRLATTENDEEKDLSALIRIAIDTYLK